MRDLAIMREVDISRRFFLGLLVALGGCATERQTRVGNRLIVDAEDFGVFPGAEANEIIQGIQSALEYLGKYGGDLYIRPGEYNLGVSSSPKSGLIKLNDSRDVRIVMDNASFVINTNYRAYSPADRTAIFEFVNPNNIEIVGGLFRDLGFVNNVEWKGVIVFRVTTTKPCRDFKISGTHAKDVVCFLWAQADDFPYTFTGFDVTAEIENSYYGVSTNRNGRFSRCKLNVTNVRRAFICYGCRDWYIDILATTLVKNPLSNGLVCFVCDSYKGSCSDIALNLRLVGYASYTSVVHFYHQGELDEGEIKNVSCDVRIDENSDGSIFRFDHEILGGYVSEYTPRSWSNIVLSVDCENFSHANIISAPTISTSGHSSIYYPRRLRDMIEPSLPAYFYSYG